MTVDISAVGKDAFEVTVTDDAGATRHRVTCSDRLLSVLAPTAPSKEAAIRAAFAFLLDREPKEDILPRFDLSIIERYFPEFRSRLPGYLAR